MKAILVGLGEAGFGWYKRLRSRGLLLAKSKETRREKRSSETIPYLSIRRWRRR
jgi:hypothetical protein